MSRESVVVCTAHCKLTSFHLVKLFPLFQWLHKKHKQVELQWKHHERIQHLQMHSERTGETRSPRTVRLSDSLCSHLCVCVCVCQHINVFPVLMFFWKREDIYLSFLCTADLWQRQLPAPPYGDPFISDCLWSEWHQYGELPSGYSQWLHKEQVNGANISMWLMKPQWDFYTCLTDNLLYPVLQSKYSLIKWAELSNVQVHSNFSILWHIAQNFKSYFITLHH